VVYFGTPRAAVPALRSLAASRHAVGAVVTQPDRPAGRGRRLEPPPVKVAAQELRLPVAQPESVGTPAFRTWLGEQRPDVLAVVAFGRIFGPKLLAVAPRGAVNLHFSLLPRWRGAAPVQRAILAGDERAGVTTMRLVRELDAGPVFLQAEVEVGAEEHAPALEARLAALGADLLVRTLDGLEASTLSARPQPAEGVTLAPPLERSEGRLDPQRPADELARRVRALDPWPGARLAVPGGEVAVLDAAVAPLPAEAPAGTVLAPRGGDLPVACGQGSVLLLRRVRPPGRGDMPGRSLVDGRFLRQGDVLATGEAT
jgi:methionyl-tRNA formyltransferase